MKPRWLPYVVAGLAVVGAVYAVNRGGPPPPAATSMDVDPQLATQHGAHDHEKLGTACLCDPDQEIRQALTDRADFAETHQELGDRFYARGQYDYALGRYKRATELDAQNARAHYGMGLVQTKLGQFAEAAKSIQEAAELDPTMTEAQISLGVLAYRAGDFDEARTRWETALRLDGQNEYAKTLLARIPKLRRVGAG